MIKRFQNIIQNLFWGFLNDFHFFQNYLFFKLTMWKCKMANWRRNMRGFEVKLVISSDDINIGFQIWANFHLGRLYNFLRLFLPFAKQLDSIREAETTRTPLIWFSFLHTEIAPWIVISHCNRHLRSLALQIPAAVSHPYSQFSPSSSPYFPWYLIPSLSSCKTR